MTSLFGGGSPVVQKTQPAVSNLQLQTSAYGKPLPLVFGATRIAPNLIWYGDFRYQTVKTGPPPGGKGGMFGGGGDGTGQSYYKYTVSLALALCEGPIAGIGKVFADKRVFADGSDLLTWVEKLGTNNQNPWNYLETNHPDSAFSYHNVAYVGDGQYKLGRSPQLPNHNFEVFGFHYEEVDDRPDADCSLVLQTLLNDERCGLNFPWPLSLSDYRDYTRAALLFISPAYMDQRPARDILTEITTLTNSDWVWSNGHLRVVPRCDEAITSSLASWTPPDPEYELTDDDFLPGEGEDGSPIVVTRKRPSDALNSIRLECLNRSNNYNTEPVSVKDQAAIDLFGLRESPLITGHIFALVTYAQRSAQLLLQRQTISNTYRFKTDLRYLLLDPMDTITLTHAGLGLNRDLVRIVTIEENDDDTLTFECEDILIGTGTVADRSMQGPQGFAADYNATPDNPVDPVIFEPLIGLAGALEIWLATSAPDGDWGGAEIWVSVDDVTYVYATTMNGPSRMGALRSGLNSVVENQTGHTIDEVNTLEVALSDPELQLLTANEQDAADLSTLCYVDGEYVAYADAVLVAAGEYDLSYLVRGALGTDISAHAAGTPFVRLDNSVARVPYRQDQIGKTIYIKMLSFNQYGGGEQSLADVSAHTYTITGVALTAPLPVVENVRMVFEDRFQKIWWDEVVDFRSGIRYKVKKGDTYAGAQEIGDVAHPPFVAFGPGTYWVTAYCQPVAELFVYSSAPSSTTVVGNLLIANLVWRSDQKTAGWPGIFTNTAKEGTGPTSSIRLVGSDNFLADADVLNNPDVLNSGGIVPLGYYEIASTAYIDLSYVANCYVNASWLAFGVPVGQDMLSVEDFLALSDVLGAASTPFVNAWVEIATSLLGAGDLYEVGDLYAEDDLYTAEIPWSAWQRFVPGVYPAKMIKFRIVMTSIDPLSICYVQQFSYDVSVAPRIDHYKDVDVPTDGATIVFVPDNADDEAPFNGGPPLGSQDHNEPLPFVTFSWSGVTGVTPVYTLTLAQLVFHFEDDLGNHVAVDNVNVTVEGY